MARLQSSSSREKEISGKSSPRACGRRVGLSLKGSRTRPGKRDPHLGRRLTSLFSQGGGGGGYQVRPAAKGKKKREKRFRSEWKETATIRVARIQGLNSTRSEGDALYSEFSWEKNHRRGRKECSVFREKAARVVNHHLFPKLPRKAPDQRKIGIYKSQNVRKRRGIIAEGRDVAITNFEGFFNLKRDCFW